MGGACSFGGMGKISSEEYSENPKMGVKDNNKIKLKNVKSFRSLKKKKKSDESDGNNNNNNNNKTPVQIQTLRFYSEELRLSSFSSDLTNPRLSARHRKVGQKGSSFIGRASFAGLERAVDVIDALGSGMTNLNNSGFLSGKIISKGNKISILAFEVANTITRGSKLMHSLSKDNVKLIKQEILSSQGLHSLVSSDFKILLCLAASDKRVELEVFCKEVIRFGNLCKDAQWHNLERFFAKLDSEIAAYRQQKDQAKEKLQELMSLSQNTSELYHELNACDRFEQDYRQKVEEMKSLNLPLKGEHLMMLQSELRQQKKIVMGLKKKSLWSRKLEEVVEKLVDIIAFIHQEIKEIFENDESKAGELAYTNTQRLGPAGLALHYANIINQIDNIASRPTCVPPNIRDTLYHGLPTSVKSAVCSSSSSSLRKLNSVDEIDVPQTKAEMENILQWLAPMAANTLKAHQGFGWVGEWANASIEFNKKTAGHGNVMRLQTLYHADKEKTDSYILQLVTLLHLLITGIRRRDYGLRTLPLQSPPKKIMTLNSTIKTFPTSLYDDKKTPKVELSEEDRELLKRMSKSRYSPGISKSQEFFKPIQRTTNSWRWSSRSMDTSPSRDQLKTCPDFGGLDLVCNDLEAPF